MNENGPTVSGQEGWYSTPSGEQRYWDGEKWLDLPPPRSEGTGAPQRRGWVLTAVLIVVVFGLVGGLLLLKSVRDEREATQQLMAEF